MADTSSRVAAGPDSAAGVSSVQARGILAIVRVKSVPLTVGHNGAITRVEDNGDNETFILDYKEEYQVCGEEFPVAVFQNAEDAVNHIRKIKGYQLLSPIAHRAWVAHRRQIERGCNRSEGSDGICFAVLQRPWVPRIGPVPAWWRTRGQIGFVLVTLSRWVRQMVDPETIYVVNGLGVGIPYYRNEEDDSGVDNGKAFTEHERALRYWERGKLCTAELFGGEAEAFWIEVLNAKNRMLPMAHYSYEREVLNVGLQSRSEVEYFHRYTP